MELDLVSIIKLSLEGSDKDLRLYLAKHIRSLRKSDPQLATKIEELLKLSPARSHDVMRKETASLDFPGGSNDDAVPHTMLKVSVAEHTVDSPLLHNQVKTQLEQVLLERKKSDLLARHGLAPTKSLIFSGPPGVGKTMTAQWLSQQLGLPLYTLDLTTVMSSFLGRTGSNLRSVIDYAKSHPSILLLDEIDAIAKKRTDESDVGELKRLVTIMLQELEDWPSSGLLVAATNHPELVDPALWRRFDLEVTFELPDESQVAEAIRMFSAQDFPKFAPWYDFLKESLRGQSYSNIKREVSQLRRLQLLRPESFETDLLTQLNFDAGTKTKAEKISFAIRLVRDFGLTQQKAAKIANVSRETIRKRLAIKELTNG
ncbi:AAA family ATPase [Pantoea agglomerans]|uniref:AAA family ATPase n=1 Tax=Pantoea vagans TaxID=470934 RepID=UPI000BEF471E|nr:MULTISPECIES: AAA family ATPase [Pantoea]MDE8556246.1 AAA family ATPase [Pantoea vagans]MDE8576297.1 AAA family ATPase [Pantoea vagans]PEI03984.1 AAA family ATPase [Pantoea agglomerans]